MIRAFYAGLRGLNRKVVGEVLGVFATLAMLVLLSRIESRLYEISEKLSENREFFTTLIYFALINLNVILVLVLSFLILRNIIKIVLERKHGFFGAKIRSKLVFALVIFALTPTILLVGVTQRFVNASFEEWFSDKVKVTIQKTREAGALIYKQDQRRLEGLARLALLKVNIVGPDEIYEKTEARLADANIKGFTEEYGITDVKLFNKRGTMVWSFRRGSGPEIPDKPYFFVDEFLDVFQNRSDVLSLGTVQGTRDVDVVMGAAPVRDSLSGSLLGVVVTEARFGSRILVSLENILSTFASLRPAAQVIRFSFQTLMLVITLLIVFSATWLGFRVASNITGPLHALAEATHEVALGNYNVQLDPKGDDETSQLVAAFNGMTKDLKNEKLLTEQAQIELRRINEEIEQRRKSMEIVLQNISAGVLSYDANLMVTSVNSIALKYLGAEQQDVSDIPGKSIRALFGEGVWQHFILPIHDQLQSSLHFKGQLDLERAGLHRPLYVDASTILDEHKNLMGTVIVFDDARERLKNQTVAAWREVARRIAHEIKNPITPIKLNAQRLLRRYLKSFEGEDAQIFSTCLESIVTQVDSLSALISEFAKFARLPEIKLAKNDLRQLLRENLEMFKSSYPQISFELLISGAIGEFLYDREGLNRVLINLITNAISASSHREQPNIKIIVELRFKSELKGSPPVVFMAISDNGVGIPEKLRQRVLEPYFSTKPEGSGLGLAIANHIITEHSGNLVIKGNEPIGTVIEIELPYLTS